MLQKGLLREEDLEPEIGPFEFYVEAFAELSTCRTSGMESGPIPFTAIIQYANVYNIDDPEDFRWIIRKIDNFALSSTKEKKKDGKTN